MRGHDSVVTVRTFGYADRWMPEGETKDQPSILLIDDEERVLTTVARGLRAAGMSVRTAIDGERGLAALAEEEPDAVILDVMMPAMDGFEVCRRIRGLSRTYVPVLLASALDPYEVWPRAVEVGAGRRAAEASEPPRDALARAQHGEAAALASCARGHGPRTR